MYSLGVKGAKLIKSFETLVLSAYPDPMSPLGQACVARRLKLWEYEKIPNWKNIRGTPWTIGWGHTKDVSPGQKINVETAQAFFESDTKWAVNTVNNFVHYPINQNQFDALVSFTFNCGNFAFKNSTLLEKLNAGDLNGVIAEFPRWNKSGGKIANGLIRRRAEEAKLFRGEI